jgi:hypothetical protein
VHEGAFDARMMTSALTMVDRRCPMAMVARDPMRVSRAF